MHRKMKGLMEEKQIFPSNTSNTAPLALAMHKDSQIISKAKPKIRIIHIFAPEIIKTDAANFRELVQRLTGKPTDDEKKMKKRCRSVSRRILEPRMFTSNKKMEVGCLRAAGLIHAAAGFRERIKGEEEIWRGANSGGGFLGGFADPNIIDGFMQEINQFPYMETTLTDHHQLDVYGEPLRLA